MNKKNMQSRLKLSRETMSNLSGSAYASRPENLQNTEMRQRNDCVCSKHSHKWNCVGCVDAGPKVGLGGRRA